MNALIERIRKWAGTHSGRTGPEKKNRMAAGYTLTEVLVVTTMLGGISLTLVGVFAYGFKFVNMNRQVTMATQAAQVRVERLRNTDYDSIPIVTGTPTTLSSTDYPFLFTAQGDCNLLNGQETVSVTPGIDENLKRLEVTITWDFQGRHLRKDVITYIAKDGINRR